MITLTSDEFLSAIKSQNVHRSNVTFLCPNCGTLQSANDLIKSGAGKDFTEIAPYLGFSCIGRWDNSKGCDWSLGGLFRIHELEVIDDKGKIHPYFIPIGADQCL